MPGRTFTTVLCGVLFIAIGCGPVKTGYEKYVLRGSIVKKDGKSVTVGTGSSGAALVGSVLQVYRMERPNRESGSDGSGYITPNNPGADRVPLGKVRIVRVVSPTMAEAQIVEGEADVNDLVDLTPIK